MGTEELLYNLKLASIIQSLAGSIAGASGAKREKDRYERSARGGLGAFLGSEAGGIAGALGGLALATRAGRAARAKKGLGGVLARLKHNVTGPGIDDIVRKIRMGGIAGSIPGAAAGYRLGVRGVDRRGEKD